MDKELKAKWVALLRSGEIKQAEGVLCDENGAMCCLGVLREVVSPGARYRDEKTIHLNTVHECGLSLDQRIALSGMNDGVGKYANDPQSFAAIADYIEAYL